VASRTLWPGDGFALQAGSDYGEFCRSKMLNLPSTDR
jgi:hypothetical protein